MEENFPKRKTNRLIEYDYSQNGAYFVTICAHDKQCIFGEIAGGAGNARPQMILSEIGCIVDKVINKISSIYDAVSVDKYVIMPNHVHLLIMINDCGRPMAAPTISTIVNQFKGYITKVVGARIARPLWQKLFYDHIIRNQNDYAKIWEYIDTNPDKWHEDKYFL